MRLLPLIAGIALAQEDTDWLAPAFTDADEAVSVGEKVVNQHLEYKDKINLLATLHQFSEISSEDRSLFNHEGAVLLECRQSYFLNRFL